MKKILSVFLFIYLFICSASLIILISMSILASQANSVNSKFRQIVTQTDNLKFAILGKYSNNGFCLTTDTFFDYNGHEYSKDKFYIANKDSWILRIPEKACEVCVDNIIYLLKEQPESYNTIVIVSVAKNTKDAKIFIHKYGLKKFNVFFTKNVLCDVKAENNGDAYFFRLYENGNIYNILNTNYEDKRFLKDFISTLINYNNEAN